MSRRVYLLGLGLALVALALVVTDSALAPAAGVTETNVVRISKGMTLAEVEAVFGKPADEQGMGVDGGGRLFVTKTWRAGTWDT